MNRYQIFFIFSLLLTSLCHAKPIEIVLWHSLAGQLGVEVKALAQDFNHSQKEYIVKPVYRGDYLEVLTSFAAAFRAKQPPALVQIFEVGMPLMQAPQGIIKPVSQLMQEQQLSLPEESFFPAVRAYYSDAGQLVAMPFNISIPVMYYNVDALAKVGVAPELFPRTWDEMEKLAKKFKKAGFSCAYTTAYPAWLVLESFAATHSLPLFNISYDKAIYNQKQLVSHVERLARWQHSNYFKYGGRMDDATALFVSGKCPIFSQSSGSYSALAALVPFQVKVAAMPFDKNIGKKRSNNVIGGAALYVVSGQTKAVEQGIAHFFIYLARPDVQQRWHERTGYLPLGIHGIYESLAAQSHQPTLAIAQVELTQTEGEVSRKHRMQSQIRLINDEMLEAVFAGIKKPQQAFDDAVARADHALIRFKRNTSKTN